MKAGRNYPNGAAFERRVKKHLEAKGYLVVRSAGSRGSVDLLAVGDYLLFVQCKRDGAVTKDERNRLIRLADKYGAHPVLAKMPSARGGVALFEMFPNRDEGIDV